MSALVDHRLALADEPAEVSESSVQQTCPNRVRVLVDEGECALISSRAAGLTGQIGGIGGLRMRFTRSTPAAASASGTRSHKRAPARPGDGRRVRMDRRRRPSTPRPTRRVPRAPCRPPTSGGPVRRVCPARRRCDPRRIAEVRGDRLVPSTAFARQYVRDHDLGEQRVAEAVPVGRGRRPRGSDGSRRRGSPSRGPPRPGQPPRSGAHRRSGPRRRRPPAGRVGHPAERGDPAARMSMQRGRQGDEAVDARGHRGPSHASASSSLASNSSAKNGLPSARAWIRSATPRAGRRPRIAVSCWRCSARSSGRSSIRSTLRLRPISASRTRSGCPRSRSSERNVPIKHHAAPTKVPDHEHQEVARRRVAPVQILEDEDERALGAQPVEQRERQLEEPGLVGGSRRGGTVASDARRPSDPRLRPRTGRTRGPRAMSSRPVSPSMVASSSGGMASPSARSASRNGPYGMPSPPRSRQPPVSTRAPDCLRVRRIRAPGGSCRHRRRRR